MNMATDGDQMVEQLSFILWGAAVQSTRAFGNVEIRISSETRRIFIVITLRWWAKYKRFGKLRKVWLTRAEKKVREQMPENWRLLIYYAKK